MTIGMVIQSQTGNTWSVAQALRQRLEKDGHTVEAVRLKASGEHKPGKTDITLTSTPDLAAYDAVVLGASVEAFSLQPIMASYLAQASSLNGKRVGLLMTQGFPFEWMGGTRAMGQMRRAVEAHGGEVCAAGIVNWMGGKARRERKTARVVDALAGGVTSDG